MVRSSCGRFSCIRFIKSRNLVSVRAVVAICWRKLAMRDYTREEGGTPSRDKTGRVVDYSLRGRTSPLGRAQALPPKSSGSHFGRFESFEFATGLVDGAASWYSEKLSA